MSNYRRLLKVKSFIKKYKLMFLGSIVFTIISSLLSCIIPYITGYIVDTIFTNNKNNLLLYKYVFFIILIYIFIYLLSIVSKFLFAKIQSFIVNDIKLELINKIIDLPFSFFAQHEKGYILDRINESNSIGTVFSAPLVGIFMNLIQAIFSLFVMFTINFKITIIILIILPISFIISQYSSKKLSKNTQLLLESTSILNAEEYELLNGIEDVKILNGKNQQIFKFKNKADNFIKHSINQAKTLALFMENIILVNNMSSVLILFLCGIMILNGNLTIGMYTALSTYVIRLFSSIQTFASFDTLINPICVNIDRVYEILECNDENMNKNGYIDEKINSISFNNIDFKYDKSNNTIIKSLNFEIIKGDKVLIKGENGTGKSTLIKLLLGLYTPTTGTIKFNNININNINNYNIRNKIGIVSQNIFLFKGTVLYNILYGLKDITKNDVERLIVDYGLKDYIDKFPNGLESEINQNTFGLSGGQSQIISFIRAVISKKEIIILDEPTSNLDRSTSNLIISILKNKNISDILIIISHDQYNFDFINKTINLSKVLY